MTTVAIILARGGSKGIPRKNLKDLCGRPLVAWSVLQACSARRIDSVWVSSDDQEILAVAEENGAHAILRPLTIANDTATSESAWLHALDVIEAKGIVVNNIVGMQPTSPIREPADLDRGIEKFIHDELDSLLSVCEVEDFFVWRVDEHDRPAGVNHDPENRKRRQNIEVRYLENGSFYVFRPRILRACNNRLGGKVGMYVMDKHKMFQIDNPGDLSLVATIFKGYGLDHAI